MRALPAEPPFAELRPLLGRKLDALEAAYRTTGDPQERDEIALVLDLVRRQATGRWSALLSPPPGGSVPGDITLGRLRHGKATLGGLGVRLEELTQHTLIVGRSGSGKTTLAAHVLLQLADRGLGWLAFDSKRSLRSVALQRPDVQVLCLGRELGVTLAWNPLVPPPGVTLEDHARELAELVCRTYTGGDAAAHVLITAIGTAARKAAPHAPTLLDVRRVVQASEDRGRHSQWRQTVLRILDHLTTGALGRALCARTDDETVRALFRHRVILELDGLSSQDALFAVQLLLDRVHRFRLAEPQREPFLVFIDEAHRLLATDRGRESLIERVLREARSARMGLVLATQTLSALSPAVLGNAYTLAVFNCRGKREVAAAASALQLDDRATSMLGTLPTGQAVVRLAGRWPAPVHLEVTDLTLPDPPDDRWVMTRGLGGPFSVQGTDSGVSARSGTDRAPVAPQGANRPLPRTSGAVSQGDSAGLEPVPTGRPSGLAVPEVPDVGGTDPLADHPDAALLLRHAAGHPFVGVAQRYDALGLSRRRGDRAKKVLEAVRIIEPVRLSVPEGQLVLLRLTDAGRAWCVRHRVAIAPINGGMEHAYWQQRVASLLVEQGWQVTTEHQLGDTRVDVFASRGEKTLVLEVETGRGNAIATIEKLQRLRGDLVALLWCGPVPFAPPDHAHVTTIIPAELAAFVATINGARNTSASSV